MEAKKPFDELHFFEDLLLRDFMVYQTVKHHEPGHLSAKEPSIRDVLEPFDTTRIYAEIIDLCCISESVTVVSGTPQRGKSSLKTVFRMTAEDLGTYTLKAALGRLSTLNSYRVFSIPITPSSAVREHSVG